MMVGWYIRSRSVVRKIRREQKERGKVMCYLHKNAPQETKYKHAVPVILVYLRWSRIVGGQHKHRCQIPSCKLLLHCILEMSESWQKNNNNVTLKAAWNHLVPYRKQNNTGQSVGISIIAWLVSICLADCPCTALLLIGHLALAGNI